MKYPRIFFALTGILAFFFVYCTAGGMELGTIPPGAVILRTAAGAAVLFGSIAGYLICVRVEAIRRRRRFRLVEGGRRGADKPAI